MWLFSNQKRKYITNELKKVFKLKEVFGQNDFLTLNNSNNKYNQESYKFYNTNKV